MFSDNRGHRTYKGDRGMRTCLDRNNLDHQTGLIYNSKQEQFRMAEDHKLSCSGTYKVGFKVLTMSKETF